MKPGIFTLCLYGIVQLVTVHTCLAQAYKITGVSITVKDMDKEINFFKSNLDFALIHDTVYTDLSTRQLFHYSGTHGIRMATLKLGTESIKLMQFIGADGKPNPIDARSNDLWFQHIAIVVKDMDSAYNKFAKNEVTHISTAPQTLPDYLPNAAGIRAFYFSDPEGHPLEIIYFPKGKGDPRWQVSSNKLFLGIDHTAIGISNTKASLDFYTSVGLKHVGHSENYGNEQEHLNEVFGARLDINGLRAEKGIGLEFLRYIAPRGGRPFPSEPKAWDLWHYQTEIEVNNLQQLTAWLNQNQYVRISESIIETKLAWSALYRDPDGHAFLITQPKSPE